MGPDGKLYVPRRSQPLRKKKGRMKREMFSWLRGSICLKAVGTGDDAVVEFTCQAQSMAQVNYYRLRDNPSLKVEPKNYEARRLLGLDAEDLKVVDEEVLLPLVERNLIP